MSYSGIERATEVFLHAASHGKASAKKVFNLTDETFNRYMRSVKEEKGLTLPERSSVLEDIAGKYTEAELKAIANGGRIIPGAGKVPIVEFDGTHVKFGCLTDTHIGHQRFSVQRIEQAFEEFRAAGVDFILHSGDVTEGMSHRPGQIYELDQIGFDAQKSEAIRLFGQWTETPIYMIDGNHDRWYIKSNGALIVKDICEALGNAHFLGHDEGDISIGGKATIKAWHGEDASSYALSYRLQKIIESLSGGEKPNILIAGHVHKMCYIFERNVHAVSVGCMQGQTSWMRGKRLAAHVGFCICDAWVPATGGVSKFSPMFFPFYA
ncbi:MAG TPA: hypothetical protein DCS09_11095 [Porphyromonadaceae bacterium]|nr:hypothetical protein [Porphyromonadaceae bacterium]